MVYSPEADAVFDLVVLDDSQGELSAFRNYLMHQLVASGHFWGLVGDKTYDSSDVIMFLEAHGVLAFIPARGGMLEPKGGPRRRASERYEALKATKNFRSLIESAFSSMKALLKEVRSRLDRAREADILVLALAYNAARIVLRRLL